MEQAAPALLGSAEAPRRGLNSRVLPSKMPSSGTSSVAGAQLADCCSQQGKQNPGGRTDTRVQPQRIPGSRVCQWLPFQHSQQDTGPAIWIY